MYYVDILVESLPQAALFALMAVGLVIIFRTTGVMNFAQGYLGLLCGYLFYELTITLPGLAFVWLGLLAIAVAALLGYFVYQIFLARVSTSAGIFVPVVYTIALAWLIEAVVGIKWQGNAYGLNSPVSRDGLHLGGGIIMSPLEIGITLVTVVFIGGLACWMRWTRIGTAMRAVSDNASLAVTYGRNLGRISGLAWAIATVAAMLAGVTYGITSTVDFSVINLGFAAFPAMLIGGIDSISGVLVGSIFVAFAENYAGLRFGGQYSEPVAMALALVVLLIRPQGLFGTRSLERV
jgi:branched-chain amino acid transport system permease protein